MNKRRIKHHEKDPKELKGLDLYSERNLGLTITVQNKVFLRYDNKDINNRILIFASDTDDLIEKIHLIDPLAATNHHVPYCRGEIPGSRCRLVA